MKLVITLLPHLININLGTNIWELVSDEFPSAKLLGGDPYTSISIEVDTKIVHSVVQSLQKLCTVDQPSQYETF